ncbi:MAG: indole-3-glycerol-phosphate synthase [Phycisphaerae bacterium]|nr:indole-3-glycerol-phosphate synthase [Phycisphaerae bacterium]
MERSSRARLAALQARAADSELRRRVRSSPAPPGLRLAGFDVIAEIKRSSPSAGVLAGVIHADANRPTADIAARAAGYARAGAAAVSVLTEPERFNGSLDDLATAAGAIPTIPVMRKDFLIHPAQVWEARASGAGGVLLIVRMLSDGLLIEMLDAAREAGLFVLVEAFDATDAARAAMLAHKLLDAPRPPVLFGLNCRDLDTLRIETPRLGERVGLLPRGFPRVAESGLAHPRDAADVSRIGYDVALIGTSLMRSAEPETALRAFIASGRSVRADPDRGRGTTCAPA